MSDQLFEAVYGELRRLAASHLRRERRDHTLSATALVHEAWLKLSDQNNQAWQNRAHFFGAASHAMRRILVDHARGRSAEKRRGERVNLTAVERELSAMPSFHELLAIDLRMHLIAVAMNFDLVLFVADLGLVLHKCQ